MGLRDPLPEITELEFVLVTKAFLKRLEEEMNGPKNSTIFNNEFPKSVCKKYKYLPDCILFDVWKEYLQKAIRNYSTLSLRNNKI